MKSRTPRHPSSPTLISQLVAADVGMAAALAQAASAAGTTPREQLRWLLETFLSADLALMRRDGRLGGLFFALSGLVMLATRGAWVPIPLPRSIKEEPVLGVDRAPWQRRPAHERDQLERARRAGQATAPVARADDAELHRLLADAQRRVYFAINSARYPSEIAEWQEIHAEVTVGLYERGPGRREFRATAVAPIPEAAMVATLALMAQVEPSLVRECPYEEGKKSSPPHFFLGVKSQRWCKRHGAAARRVQLRAAQDRHRKRTSSRSTGRRTKGGSR